MNTSIVYVLVSDQTDYFYEQALLSATSARLWNPEADVFLLVDDVTDSTLSGSRAEILKVISKKIVVDFPEGTNKKRRSRLLKTSMRNRIDGDFLYIDTDTIVCQSLEEIDKVPYEIGAVLDSHIRTPKDDTVFRRVDLLGGKFNEGDPYYNSGVMYVKDTPKTRRFFEEWSLIYEYGLSISLDFDQPSLYLCNQKLKMIHPLEGEFNCQIFTGGLPYLGYAKIIHAFNTYSFNAYFGGSIFVFSDTSYLKEIKQKGRLDEKDLKLMKEAKRQFHGDYILVYGQNLEYNKSVLFHLFADNRKLFHLVEFIGKVLLKLSRMFGK